MNRSGPLPRVPLRRTKGLPPGGPLSRRVPLRPVGSKQAAGYRAPRRNTGFSRQVKLAVRKRAGNQDINQAACESCGRWLGRYGGQVQHRDARGMGGSSGPAAGSVANAALLCGSPLDKETCHGRAESRDREMHDRGWWLENGEDPALTPVMLSSPHGSGVTVWLGEDGTYKTKRPAAAA